MPAFRLANRNDRSKTSLFWLGLFILEIANYSFREMFIKKVKKKVSCMFLRMLFSKRFGPGPYIFKRLEVNTIK